MIRVELWGGIRDGEIFELDDAPPELKLAPVEPADGSDEQRIRGGAKNPIAALVYGITGESMSSGATRYRFLREELRALPKKKAP